MDQTNGPKGTPPSGGSERRSRKGEARISKRDWPRVDRIRALRRDAHEVPEVPTVRTVRTMVLRALHLGAEYERNRRRFEDDDALFAFKAVVAALDDLWARRNQRYQDEQAAAAIDLAPTRRQVREGMKAGRKPRTEESYTRSLASIYRDWQEGVLEDEYRRDLLRFAKAINLGPPPLKAEEVASLLYLTQEEIRACRGPVEAAAEALGHLRNLRFEKMLAVREHLPVGSAPIEGGVELPDAPFGEYLLRYALGLLGVPHDEAAYVLEAWRKALAGPEAGRYPNLKRSLPSYEK